MYNVKAVQQHDFVCDNNNMIYNYRSNVVNDHDYNCFNDLKSLNDNNNDGGTDLDCVNNNGCDHVNNNKDNANSIQAIVASIIEVMINDILYIPAI